MKKIKLKESDLVNLIEKLVKENLGFGNGQNLGMMDTPTAKYKDLLEKDDIEETEEEVEEEETMDMGGDMVDPVTGKVVATESKKTLSLTETQLINLIEKTIKDKK